MAVVILQLRFQPILKVTGRIADFQERVRARFPGFDTVESQSLEVTSDGLQPADIQDLLEARTFAEIVARVMPVHEDLDRRAARALRTRAARQPRKLSQK